MLRFFAENARWLGAGLLLTFASAFGQTWFISLFAGEIKAEYGLTDGGWGILYTVATLAAAALLLTTGSWADTVKLSALAPATALLFAAAALGVVFGRSLWVLGLSLFLLRFCGQGVFGHIAMTAMGCWFQARRGQAVSISNLGHPAGEIVVPIVTVFVIGVLGWHLTWAVVAAALAFVVSPLLFVLLSSARMPQGALQGSESAGLSDRHWARSDALGHWLFPALLPIILTPGFIGTVVFFHQVNIAQVKDWTLSQMAPGYTAFASSTVAAALMAGLAADRYGPHRVLPILLLPMGCGVALIGPADGVGAWYVALALIGVSQGMQSALWGTFLPTIYGTRHLGSVRSLVTTIMVISTAIGPGITGILIDAGIGFPTQALALAVWCFGLSALGTFIERRLTDELGAARS